MPSHAGEQQDTALPPSGIAPLAPENIFYAAPNRRNGMPSSSPDVRKGKEQSAQIKQHTRLRIQSRQSGLRYRRARLEPGKARWHQ